MPPVAGDSHLSADDLVASVRHTMATVARSIIYRTLEHLEALGMVVRAGIESSGPATYHLSADEHHHTVCDGCGRLVEVPAPVFDPIGAWLDTELGFAAHPRHLAIRGLCRRCRPRRKAVTGGA